MQKKDICERTFKLALRIVKLCQYLEEQDSGVGKTLGKQLLRSGTSIGANVEEAQAAQSKADFVNKLNIALKEARETDYWLRLLLASDMISEARLQDLKAETEEVTGIIGAIIANTKSTKNP
ncbi:four helix bundle protein [Roseofilum sp. BLCC_M91]|uniref:Four helix bundle protein n=1 Tax=Roseofilum halophilum BLCC-M91 TaxID=3022259 RepID=A0ABT7BIS0_9CYAN|nr:four helix bundle protein [Roseofilum halophilum]MDJ1179056.1 four helix bundle protein [Roseofilum halophilum BLCC-M91]